MTLHDLKQIQLYRQHLTNPAEPTAVVRELCGLQAQFWPYTYHALRIRSTAFDEDTVTRSMVKNWTIRGTLHLFATEDLPLFVHADGGQNYRKNEWSGRRFWNQRDRWALTPARQAYLSGVILDALQARPHTREELKTACRTAGMTEAEENSMFDPWGGGVRELCERGFLHYIAEENKAFCLTPPYAPMEKDTAELELCRRYLTHMAPATLRDLCYYLKCTKTQAKAWLSRLPTRSLTAEGRQYFYLGDLESDCPDLPPALFLAGFDQLMLAYEKQDSIYLPSDDLRGIFTRSGIVLPAILLDGTVRGRWKKTRHKLEILPFRPLTCQEKAALSSAAETTWPNDLTAIAYH